jgi:hypothetical protein
MTGFDSATSPRTAPARLVRLIAVVACLAAVPAVTGCGTKGVPTYPVRGTVTLDGKPVDGATVMFVPPAGPPNSAVTDNAGTFAIAAPGVPAGACGVTITKMTGGPVLNNPTPEDLQRLAQNPAAAKPPTSVIPEKFGRTDTSGLSANVTSDASKNVFDFDLKP